MADQKLTPRQELFVQHYVATGVGTTAAEAAGYKTSNRNNTAALLLQKPKIQKAIERERQKRNNRLRVDQDYVILKLLEIVEANIGDYLTFEGKSIKFKDMEGVDLKKIGLIKDISTNDKGIKISLYDKVDALTKLAKHLGMFDKHGMAKTDPDTFTRDILLKLKNKDISPVDAALTLEAEGLPLPESVRILLSKVESEPTDTDNGTYAVISPEEMAARAKQKQEAIDRQEDFVSKRQQEVEELREELGGGSFLAQKVEDGKGKGNTD